jgi:predicted nucleic acid-binding protein
MITARLIIQKGIKNGDFELAWSFILDFENEQNPFDDIKDSIKLWKQYAAVEVAPETSIKEMAEKYVTKYGFQAKDSLHISAAIFSGSAFLITTDSKMIKKGQNLKKIRILNPISFIAAMEVEYDQ